MRLKLKRKKKEEKKEKEKEEDTILNKTWENTCAENNLTFKDVLPTRRTSRERPLLA